MKKIIIFLITILLLSCSNKNIQNDFNKLRPKWINHPEIAGKKTAIGMAKLNVKGINEQKKTAISRAVDDLAMQTGVKVQTELTKKDFKQDSYTSNSMEQLSIQTTSGVVLQFTIKEFWTDPKTEDIYVWVVLDN